MIELGRNNPGRNASVVRPESAMKRSAARLLALTLGVVVAGAMTAAAALAAPKSPAG